MRPNPSQKHFIMRGLTVTRKRRNNRDKLNWYRVDLHVHTPGSQDYLEPKVDYLDILHKAESCGLDIIAFTDHNTVAGIRALRKEVEELLLLERLNRISGLPIRLSDAGVKKENLNEAAKAAINDGALIYNPREVEFKDALEIYKKAL